MATESVTSLKGITVGSLIALALGLVAGIALHASGSPAGPMLGRVVAPLGDVWVAALQVTVLPLVLSGTLAAILGAAGPSLGRLGARAFALFVTMLLAAGVFTVAVSPAVLALYAPDPGTGEALLAGTVVPESAHALAAGASDGIGAWFRGLLPTNIFAAASAGHLLPLLIFTVAFGMAATRLPEESRKPIEGVARAVAATMMVLIRWVLVITPLGVFALTYELALGSGGEAAGFFAVFVVGVSALMLLGTGLLYPFTMLFGRVGLREFASGAAPAQLVAVSSRSSLASLPALVQCARERLRLPESATGFVLPVCVSTFKVNLAISSTFKVLFLAHVFGITVGPWQMVTFLVSITLLSFSALGIPGGGGGLRNLPAYMAAGIPIEGIVVLEAVDTIPDIFKTLINVTADMSVAVILSRDARLPVAAEPVLVHEPAVLA